MERRLVRRCVVRKQQAFPCHFGNRPGTTIYGGNSRSRVNAYLAELHKNPYLFCILSKCLMSRIARKSRFYSRYRINLDFCAVLPPQYLHKNPDLFSFLSKCLMSRIAQKCKVYSRYRITLDFCAILPPQYQHKNPDLS